MKKQRNEKVIFSVEGGELSYYEKDGQFIFVKNESADFDLIDDDSSNMADNETVIFSSLEELKTYVMEKYPYVDEEEFSEF